MPVAQRHLGQQHDRLSPREVRLILRERWARIGRHAYSEGDYAAGLRLLVPAMLRGDRPLFDLVFLVGGAPPVRRLKHLVRLRAG